jgi:hypothetical protein
LRQRTTALIIDYVGSRKARKRGGDLELTSLGAEVAAMRGLYLHDSLQDTGTA